MDRLVDRMTRQDGYCFFQPREVDEEAMIAETRTFSVGDNVEVKQRHVRGKEREGGAGRIVGFDKAEGTYSVKYVLRIAAEDGVHPRWIVPAAIWPIIAKTWA